MEPPLLALTGGSGFLGARIAALAAKRGWRVRVMVRGMGRTVPGAAEQISGDLGDQAALCRLVTNAALILHNAGAVRARSAQAFMAVNRDGAAAVAEATRAAAPQDAPFVLVSSLAATRPTVSAYAASKAAAEMVVRERLAGRPLAIARPPAIYGPNDAATKPLFDAIRRGFAPVLGAAQQKFAMIYVDDAASACLAAGEAAAAAAPVFAFDDGAGGHDWAGLRRAAEAAVGRPLRRLSVPPWAIRLVGASGTAVAKAGLATPFLTSGKAAEMLAGDWLVPPGSAPPGWAPTVDLETGFRQTLEWYRKTRR